MYPMLVLWGLPEYLDMFDVRELNCEWCIGLKEKEDLILGWERMFRGVYADSIGYNDFKNTSVAHHAKLPVGGRKDRDSHRREELANLTGTSTESLIRMLCDFRSEGLIGIESDDIEILHEEKLKNMLN